MDVLGIGGLWALGCANTQRPQLRDLSSLAFPIKTNDRISAADEVVRHGKGLAQRSADVILSTSKFDQAMVDSIQGLRPAARLVTMGAERSQFRVSLIDLISKRIRIIGSQQNGPEYLYERLIPSTRIKSNDVETYRCRAPRLRSGGAGQARFRAVLTM